jgi:hypothetical protein
MGPLNNPLELKPMVAHFCSAFTYITFGACLKYLKCGINHNGNPIISGFSGLPLPAFSGTGFAEMTVIWTSYEFIKFDIA